MGLRLAVAEAASWRIAASLVRRNPHLTLFQVHPGGGTYDVLSLRSPHGAEIMLNRAYGEGTIQVHGREGGEKPPTVRPIDWIEVLSAPDPLEIVERIEQQARLEPTGFTPPTRRDAVLHTLAALASLGALSEPFRFSQGFFDSSGFSGSEPADWWDPSSRTGRGRIA